LDSPVTQAIPQRAQYDNKLVVAMYVTAESFLQNFPCLLQSCEHIFHHNSVPGVIVIPFDSLFSFGIIGSNILFELMHPAIQSRCGIRRHYLELVENGITKERIVILHVYERLADKRLENIVRYHLIVAMPRYT